eukprot:Ihof_evm4s368 gene=Ihof_evmTU4s368
MLTLAPQVDVNMTTTKYDRTDAQAAALGLSASEGSKIKKEQSEKLKKKVMTDFQLGTKGKVHLGENLVAQDQIAAQTKLVDGKEEVMKIDSYCPGCMAECEVRMHVLDIPYFKDVVIMAVTCDACGNRSSEVKVGGGIASKGRKITLKITCTDDLSRDVLKAESATITIPEIGLEHAEGVDGCKFTTLEGLLIVIRDRITVDNPFFAGDSAPNENSRTMKTFISELQEVIDGKRYATFIMDDPSANSYIQNLYAPDPDPEMIIE